MEKVSGPVIAARLGVSDQTVRNWAKRGLRDAAGCGVDDSGVSLYDWDKARDWAKNNTGGPVGGRRPGSGRKAGLWAAAAAVPVENVKAKEPATAVALGGAVSELVAGTEVKNLDQLMELVAAGKIPLEMGTRIKVLVEASLKYAQLKLESKTWIDSTEWVQSLTKFLTVIRQRLEAFPARVAGEAAARMGPMTHEQLVVLRQMVNEEVESLIEEVSRYGKEAQGDADGKLE